MQLWKRMVCSSAWMLAGWVLAQASPPPDTTRLASPPLVYDRFEDLEPIFHLENDTTYVINFWATWCKPCVEELPYIEQVHEAFEGEKVRVILVSLDFPNQIQSKLIPFIESNRLRSEVVVLTDMRYNDWIDRVEPTWGGAIPVTLFYRGDERIFVDTPFHAFEEVETIVRKLLLP